MSDSKWAAVGAFVSAAATVATSIVERQKPPSNDPGLHERMAVIEEKMRRLEAEEIKGGDA